MAVGPEEEGPEEEEAPVDKEVGGSSKRGGGEGMCVEEIGDVVDGEGNGAGEEMTLGRGCLKG